MSRHPRVERSQALERLIWWTPDLPTTLRRFGRLLDVQLAASSSGGPVVLGLGPTALEFRSSSDRSGPRRGDPRDEVIELAPAPGRPSTPEPPVHPAQVVSLAAVGWATVDATRTAEAFAPLHFEPAGADQALGASVLAASAADPAVLLLEPHTEGRLAAALARHGEGPVALYIRVEAGRWSRHRPMLQDAGERIERVPEPPLGGAAWLLRPSRPWGPFLVLVE